MGFTRPHSCQVAHVYYQLFDSKMADGDQLWSVPKLENDLLRRNASTNGRKTDLNERYILHRKPQHPFSNLYKNVHLLIIIKLSTRKYKHYLQNLNGLICSQVYHLFYTFNYFSDNSYTNSFNFTQSIRTG